MPDLSIQRQNRLLEIAERDMIYCTWEKSFDECREKFMQFADRQPAEIRSVLYGYADCGRMAQQRLVNLLVFMSLSPETEFMIG